MTRVDNETSIKLLVIDNDYILTDMIKVAYPPEGFEIVVIDSGPAGIEAARQIEPDVILLDLMMPGMDGWQICRKIREFSNVPIMIMSAVIDSRLVLQALDVGADDYLVKPTPQGVLVSRLKRLVRQSRSG